MNEFDNYAGVFHSTVWSDLSWLNYINSIQLCLSLKMMHICLNISFIIKTLHRVKKYRCLENLNFYILYIFKHPHIFYVNINLGSPNVLSWGYCTTASGIYLNPGPIIVELLSLTCVRHDVGFLGDTARYISVKEYKVNEVITLNIL